MAPEAEDGAVRAGRKVVMGHWGKNECPDQTKMGPDAKSGGVAKGVFEPVTEEMSNWAGC